MALFYIILEIYIILETYYSRKLPALFSGEGE